MSSLILIVLNSLVELVTCGLSSSGYNILSRASPHHTKGSVVHSFLVVYSLLLRDSPLRLYRPVLLPGLTGGHRLHRRDSPSGVNLLFRTLWSVEVRVHGSPLLHLIIINALLVLLVWVVLVHLVLNCVVKLPAWQMDAVILVVLGGVRIIQDALRPHLTVKRLCRETFCDHRFDRHLPFVRICHYLPVRRRR